MKLREYRGFAFMFTDAQRDQLIDILGRQDDAAYGFIEEVRINFARSCHMINDRQDDPPPTSAECKARMTHALKAATKLRKILSTCDDDGDLQQFTEAISWSLSVNNDNVPEYSDLNDDASRDAELDLECDYDDMASEFIHRIVSDLNIIAFALAPYVDNFRSAPCGRPQLSVQVSALEPIVWSYWNHFGVFPPYGRDTKFQKFVHTLFGYANIFQARWDKGIIKAIENCKKQGPI